MAKFLITIPILILLFLWFYFMAQKKKELGTKKRIFHSEAERKFFQVPSEEELEEEERKKTIS